MLVPEESASPRRFGGVPGKDENEDVDDDDEKEEDPEEAEKGGEWCIETRPRFIDFLCFFGFENSWLYLSLYERREGVWLN